MIQSSVNCDIVDHHAIIQSVYNLMHVYHDP